MFATAIAFFRTKAGLTVLGALAVALICLALIAHGASKERKRQEARRAIEVAEAQAFDTRADQKSSAQLAAEGERIAQKQEELTNAVAQAPDSAPGPAAVLWGCGELQRNGISTADLPACRTAPR